MIDIDQLAEDVPGIAELLGKRFVKDALKLVKEAELGLDGVYPTVMSTFQDKEGNTIRFIFGLVDPEDDSPLDPSYTR